MLKIVIEYICVAKQSSNTLNHHLFDAMCISNMLKCNKRKFNNIITLLNIYSYILWKK